MGIPSPALVLTEAAPGAQDPETGKPLDEDSLIAEFSMLMIAGVVGRLPCIVPFPLPLLTHSPPPASPPLPRCRRRRFHQRLLG